MKSSSVLVVTCFLGCAVLLGQSSGNGSAEVSLNESFEPPVPDVPPWVVLLGSANVTSDTSYSGNYSLKIEATTPLGQVAFNLPAPNLAPVLFVDFRLLAIAGNGTAAAASTDASGAQTGFLQVNSQGQVYAYDAHAGQWVATGALLDAGPGGALKQWVRLTMRLDRSAGTWDLYVNGAMVEAGLGLDPASGQQLVLFGETSAPVYVDDVYAGTTNPLFVDTEGDGLPDAWVIAQTGSLTLPANPRAWIVPAAGSAVGGITLLQEYLQTVSALSAYTQLYAQPVVLVHPTNRSWSDLATFLQVLNTAEPSGDANEQAFLNGLVGALQNASLDVLAGLPAPQWQFAPDIATAAQVAPDGATIVVFPSNSPYVLTNFDPQGRQITLDCLEGTGISTPDRVTDAQNTLNQDRASVLAKLSANPQWSGTMLTELTSLWPGTSQGSPSPPPSQ